MSDVIVIGGGVIGLTIALELAQAGQKVTLLEKQQLGQEASWAGAGMLPCILPDPEVETLRPLFRAANHRWPKFSQWLLDQTGIDNEYQVSGALILDPELNADQLHSLRLEPEMKIEPVNSARVMQKYVPGMKASIEAGTYLANYAQVRNPRHLKALRTACLKHDVLIIEQQPVLSWDMRSENITGVRTSSGNYHADKYVIAAGAWSAPLLKTMGYVFPLRPIRGQMMLYQLTSTAGLPIIDCGIQYIVPRRDGHLLIGSTEEDVDFVKTNTESELTALKQFAAQYVPEIKGLEPIQVWSGLRPFHAGKTPLIGRLPKTQNMWIAAGHFRWGLQLSKITAELIRQSMFEETTEFDLTPFTPQCH
jgi:glycine oxidase